jgi:hypothetical protein
MISEYAINTFITKTWEHNSRICLNLKEGFVFPFEYYMCAQVTYSKENPFK